jgi:hypothetical protein
VKTSWRPDFQRVDVVGGHHYEGVALELLGRPANDGLATIAMRLPDAAGAKPAARISALGAVDVTMPAGRYLLVLIGDAPVRVVLPVLGSVRIAAVSAAGRHRVRFVEAAGKAGLAPGTTGLYAGGLGLRLPLDRDPLVMTHVAATFAPGPQLFDVAACARRDNGACPAAQEPTFGTGNTTSDGGAVQTDQYYDGFDGVTARQEWFARADLRTTEEGASLYTAAVVVNGNNR